MKIFFDKDEQRYARALRESSEISMNSPTTGALYAEQIMDELRIELARIGCSVGYPLSSIGKADASGWEGGYCMHEEDGYWLVYHSERGLRSIPDVFSGVQNAANFFLWIHVANPSAGNKDVGMLPRLKE